MEQVRQLLQIRKLQPVRLGQGVTEREIHTAESDLGVAFSRSYRKFLHDLGWIESPYISVFGLGTDQPAYDVIEVTRSERRDAALALPLSLVPVMNDGSGNLYCLDVSQMHESECPIILWDHESFEGTEQVPAQVGTDFLDWLVHELTELGS